MLTSTNVLIPKRNNRFLEPEKLKVPESIRCDQNVTTPMRYDRRSVIGMGRKCVVFPFQMVCEGRTLASQVQKRLPWLFLAEQSVR